MNPAKHAPDGVAGRLDVVDLAPHGRTGAALCWRARKPCGSHVGVVAMVQRKGARILARIGFLQEGEPLPGPGGMTAALLSPVPGSGIVVLGGPEAGEAAMAFAAGLNAIEIARLAGYPDGADHLVRALPDAVATFADAFGPEWVAVEAAARNGLPVQAASAMMRDAPHGPSVRGLLASYPMAMAAALSSRTVLDLMRSGVSPHDAMAGACPGYRPAHMRRCEGVPASVLDAVLRQPRHGARLAAARTVLRMCAALPPERMPGPSEWPAALAVALALESSYVLDYSSVTASRGGWDAVYARLRRLAGCAPDAPGHEAVEAVRAAARDMGDASAALAVQLVMPLAARARVRAGFPVTFGDDDDIEVPALAAARGLLFGDKGLAASLETSVRWHRNGEAMARGFMTANADLSWAVPFPPYRSRTARGIVEALPLGDALSLFEEGASGPDRHGAAGLDHCVFGRLGAALRGDAHVLSLRLLLPDGRYERLSTAQLRLGATGFEVEEHGGRSNGPVPDGCGAVLLELAALYAGVPLDVMARPPCGDDPVRDACGYDWTDDRALSRALAAWSPFLPRWARAGDLDAVTGALAQRGVLRLPGPAARLAA